ncbi:MAG: hypothetical protein K2X76_03000 [Sphingomonas sp.]|nr:hypothetical protein [Sphingomonas sp.]
MLLVEDRLDVLLDQLRRLPRADQRAILRHLDPTDRQRIAAMLAGQVPPTPGGYSPQLNERVQEARGKRAAPRPLTPAASRALLAATGQGKAPGPSLASAIGDLLQPRGRP